VSTTNDGSILVDVHLFDEHHIYYLYSATNNQFYSISKLLSWLGLTAIDDLADMYLSANGKFLLVNYSMQHKRDVIAVRIEFPTNINDFVNKNHMQLNSVIQIHQIFYLVQFNIF
jgi:hypothetical protein